METARPMFRYPWRRIGQPTYGNTPPPITTSGGYGTIGYQPPPANVGLMPWGFPAMSNRPSPQPYITPGNLFQEAPPLNQSLMLMQRQA
jgi:hypothetical protein